MEIKPGQIYSFSKNRKEVFRAMILEPRSETSWEVFVKWAKTPYVSLEWETTEKLERIYRLVRDW